MRSRRSGGASGKRPMHVMGAFPASMAGVVVLLVGLGALITPATPAAAAPPAQGWTTTTAPLPSDAGNGTTNPNVYIASSVCPQANGCVTVGWYTDDSTNHNAWGLIEQQSGTTWTETEAPDPSTAASGSTEGLWLGSQNCGIATEPCHAVSCPTTSFCVAVGEFNLMAGGKAPVVETYNGSGWSATQVALPNDANATTLGYLQSVSCTSTTSCVAVGAYNNTSGTTLGMVATLSGSTWSAQVSQQPPDLSTTAPLSTLTSVSCASPSACVAIGTYTPTVGSGLGWIAQLANGSWSALSAPLPSNKDTSNPSAQLYDVQCPTTSFCVAVGGYQIATSHFGGLIDIYSGGVWTGIQAQEPSNSANTDAALFGVSCPTSTSCGVVGGFDDTGGHARGLIDQLAGGTWSATSAPQPSNAAPEANQNAHLETISCPTPSFCSTSGYYRTTVTTVGFVDTLQGGSWAVAPAPLPSNAQSSSYAKSVACYSPVACIVAGSYQDPSSHTQGYLDTWTGAQAYWLDASDGGIFTYPNNTFFGSTGGLKLNKPMVGMAATPDGQGYWLVASDGGVFGFGDAVYWGSRGGQPLFRPIVGMAATPDGGGYWLVASDGGIFTYGDAGYFGSRGGQPINAPIVGMAATADGRGYWLVGSDGGIYSYGDAQFHGSTGALKLNKPVVGMAGTPTGLGYWLVASDGGIFNYGDAQFYGSTGSLVLNKPVVGMAGSPSGLGYWLVASDGGIFNYGDAPFDGSAGSLHLNAPVVGMAGG